MAQGVMVIQQGGAGQKNAWSASLCDCCAAPGGCGTCMYVLCCSCCAAGDVAKAAGRDYCMSCCVISFLCPFIAPCWYASDRSALTQKFNINDGFGYATVCCMFMLGCGTCLLCQELNTIKDFENKGIQPVTGGAGGGTTLVIMSPGAAPGQQTMGQAPAY